MSEIDLGFDEEIQTTEDAVAFFENKNGTITPYTPNGQENVREMLLRGDLSAIGCIDTFLS